VVEYSYYIPSYYKEGLRQRALMDAYGLQWNPAIIWNAIPWSFVIDWILGVSRWLDQFKETNVRIVTGIRRYCCSLSYAREIHCKTQSGLNAGAPLYGAVLTNRTIREEVYERIPRIPDLYQSLLSSGLNLKEFSYIGALALTKNVKPYSHFGGR
jgi:hypothetical protein